VRFRATLDLHGKTATGISVPPEAVESLGAGKRPPVRVTIGDYTYRTTIAPRGGGFLLPVSGEHRAAAGVSAGDSLDVTIELDTEPREVVVPGDLAKALAVEAEAAPFFDALSFSHKRAYVDWIEGAKAADTRERRVAKAIEMLREGRKR
jgi:hypothetical protein